MTTESTPLLAYHGDPAIKEKYLARVRAHRAADELTQGIGYQDGRGCAVGCTLDAYDHSRYPIELGVPEVLAYLEDRLHELQKPLDSVAWPERFLSAIREGADLSRVWPEWAIWMLMDPQHGVRQYASPDGQAAIDRVAELYLVGGSPAEFNKAAAAAKATAAAAAMAMATATWASWAAAWAAAEVAASPDCEAWVYAACDKLIALLEAA